MAIKIIPTDGACIRIEGGYVVIEGWHFETDGKSGIQEIGPVTLEFFRQRAVLEWLADAFENPNLKLAFKHCFIEQKE